MPLVTKGNGAIRESAIEPANDPSIVPLAIRGGRLAVFARGVYSNDRKLQLVLLAFMLLWCGALLSISCRLDRIDPIRLTFNSMLDHMLHGRYDVDPQIVQGEGYLRNGRVYSYFGIWCALLRLPLWFAGRMNLDITFWSCLAAVCVAGAAKIRALLLVRGRAIPGVAASWAIGLMLAYVLLAGSTVAYLIDEIYTEVLLWGYAFAAIFVYFALKGIVNRHFNPRTLSCMALCAGLALLTRVSTGAGLFLATVVLLFVLAIERGKSEMQADSALLWRLRRGFARRRILIPLGILVTFAAIAGVINYFRWGNPATFVNYDLYLMRDYWPSFLPSLHNYGAFNLSRIPFGLSYYFLPIWVLHGPSGQLLFESTQTRLFGDIELPPGSFFLTDLLPLCFIALLVTALWRRRAASTSAPGRWAVAVSLGLLAPCILMMTLAWMIYRYRLEFYPEIEFLAFLGLYLTVMNEAMLATFDRFRRWLAAGLTVSVLASMMALALCNLSGDEPPQELLRPGIAHYYYNQAAFHFRHEVARHFSAH